MPATAAIQIATLLTPYPNRYGGCWDEEGVGGSSPRGATLSSRGGMGGLVWWHQPRHNNEVCCASRVPPYHFQNPPPEAPAEIPVGWLASCPGLFECAWPVGWLSSSRAVIPDHNLNRSTIQ
jgi:hypothetical protein